MLKYRDSVDQIIGLALQEDLGSGDITTNSLIPSSSRATAFLVAKADGVASGLSVARRVFEMLDSTLEFEHQLKEGDSVKAGDVLAKARASYRALLSGERVALNLLQHLCGVATRTRRFVNEIGDRPTRLLDTRKTMPGLRLLDKMAVKHGGGANHRMGLYDLALIKDNHIEVAGGITEAVRAVRAAIPVYSKVEVETATLAQVEEALACGVEIIMLDNMTNEQMREAVTLINGRALTEASGNVTEERVASIADCGVDFISVGAITHSAPALDISMRIQAD